MKKLPSLGFTLIELLIVITIIAILSAIGLIAYSNFLKTSRDSRRQSDLKFIQSGLEDYHSDQLFYPSILTPDSALEYEDKRYLNKVPKDPISSQQYSYVAKPQNCTGSACRGYCLYASMERLTAPYTEDSINCPNDSTYNYAVTRP